MSEKNIRRHRRIAYSTAVRLSWPDRNGLDKYVLAKCLDISENGLSLQSPEPIPVRTVVSLRAERLNLSGSATVKHVQRMGAKYVVGLELSEALRERTIALITASVSPPTL